MIIITPESTPIQYETRNVLDCEDVIVGTLSLPVGTSEEEWTEKLNVYKNAHHIQTQEEKIRAIIASAIAFGHELVSKFTVENVLLGITMAGKTGPVADYLNKLNYYIKTGSLYEAINEIDRLVADQNRPAGLDPFVTNERLEEYKLKIRKYLGMCNE